MVAAQSLTEPDKWLSQHTALQHSFRPEPLRIEKRFAAPDPNAAYRAEKGLLFARCEGVVDDFFP
jgi:hypothetical protein